MDVIEDAGALRKRLAEERCRGGSIGLVPTMGYLHAGHLRLTEVARGENDIVVMSVYVNPTQFGPSEDFDRYPRDLVRDQELASSAGVDILFAPATATVYPDGPSGQRVWVEPGTLAQHMEGASRPGHFRGVATMVAKLFNFVQPDRAYFGQKDAQQALIVSAMARDLAIATEIRIVATVREDGGLALSSRNVYLSPAEHVEAAAISRALRWAREAISCGERDSRALEEGVRRRITADAPAARIDYVAIAGLADLRPLEGPLREDALFAVAVYFGRTRLIDNVIVRFHGGTPYFD